MNAVDTNVFVYAHDPRDVRKQAIALRLLNSLPDGVLIWQVAIEFLASSRKLQPLGFNWDQAWHDVFHYSQTWATIMPDWRFLARAQKVMTQYSFSFWDALIVGTCLEANVQRLYKEDFTGYPRIGSLEIVNPF